MSCILQIHWLESPLNRTLKRLADISLSLLFLLTIFPIIFILQAIVSKRNNSKSILTSHKMHVGNEKHISGVVFRTSIFPMVNHAERFPLALNILVGSISIWDLPLLEDAPDYAGNARCGTENQTSCINHDLIGNNDNIDEKRIHDEDNPMEHDQDQSQSLYPDNNKPTETDDWI
ncbi:MAG: hypothetical protein K2J00_01660 [Bacteroidaceae bacterium]|nr:hypothetical protein [Bacteroidaceae bacterium]